MLNLRTSAPMVKFRADLPEWFVPGAFVEIDARPLGRVNSAYMAAMDEARINHRMRMGNETPGDVLTPEQERATRASTREWYGVIYDTCVMAWRTNLEDEAGPLECNRANFLELAGTPIAELTAMFNAFVAQAAEACNVVLADTEATIKN